MQLDPAYETLIAAIQKGEDQKVLGILTEQPQLLERVNAQGQSIVHLAIIHKKPQVLTQIYHQVIAAKKKDLLFMPDHSGKTPLFCAAEADSPDLLWTLIGLWGPSVYEAAKLVTNQGAHVLDLENLNPVVRIMLELICFYHPEVPSLTKTIVVNGDFLKEEFKRYPEAKVGSSLRVNLAVAWWMIERSRKANVAASGTHPSTNEYSLTKVLDTHQRVNKLRTEYQTEENKMKVSKKIKESEKTLKIHQMKVKKIKKSKYANCHEFAEMGYAHAREICPTLLCENAKMYKGRGDHRFNVLARAESSNPSDYTTWGDSAVVSDGWSLKAYPAIYIPEELQCYFLYRRKNQNILMRFNNMCHIPCIEGASKVKPQPQTKPIIVLKHIEHTPLMERKLQLAKDPAVQVFCGQGPVKLVRGLQCIEDFLAFMNFLHKRGENFLFNQLLDACKQNDRMFKRVCCLPSRHPLVLEDTIPHLPILEMILKTITPAQRYEMLSSYDSFFRNLFQVAIVNNSSVEVLRKIISIFEEYLDKDIIGALLQMGDIHNHSGLDLAPCCFDVQVIRIIFQFYKEHTTNEKLIRFLFGTEDQPNYAYIRISCQKMNLNAIKELFKQFPDKQNDVRFLMNAQIETIMRLLLTNQLPDGNIEELGFILRSVLSDQELGLSKITILKIAFELIVDGSCTDLTQINLVWDVCQSDPDFHALIPELINKFFNTEADRQILEIFNYLKEFKSKLEPDKKYEPRLFPPNQAGDKQLFFMRNVLSELPEYPLVMDPQRGLIMNSELIKRILIELDGFTKEQASHPQWYSTPRSTTCNIL